MSSPPAAPAAAQRPGECPWPVCGQLAPIAVLVEVRGEPSELARPVGCWCVGHAVIVGVAEQARQGGKLWYGPRSAAGHAHLAAARN